MATKKENTEVVKVEETPNVPVATSLFGSAPGENFLTKTLGQNFKQVKETLIQRKSEDIERVMGRNIQDKIIDLKRKFESIQDDLIAAVPTSPMQTLNLNSIDPRQFCDGMENWRIEIHNNAQRILAMIDNYQNMFGKKWDEEEKSIVKSMIIDFRNI